MGEERERGREGYSRAINITEKLNLKDLGDIKQDNYLYQDSIYYLQSELIVFSISCISMKLTKNGLKIQKLCVILSNILFPVPTRGLKCGSPLCML